jgi:hypothetical protein
MARREGIGLDLRRCLGSPPVVGRSWRFGERALAAILVVPACQSGRVLESLSEARRAVALCAAAPAWAVSDRDLVACLGEAWAGVQQLTATMAHLVRQAQSRGVPRAHGASSAVVWLRDQFRISPAEGKRLVKLAEALDERPPLDDAVSAGLMSGEQATMIAAIMRQLPKEVGCEVLADAESALIGLADQFDPTQLEKAGAHVLALVAPELEEQHEQEYVDRLEQEAYRKRAFTISPFGEGLFRLSGYLDAAGAAIVNAALDPLCHPRSDPAGPRTPAQRRADALVDVCAAALRGDMDLPKQGGDAAQVVVTVPFDVLIDQLAESGLHPGARPASTARRASAAGFAAAGRRASTAGCASTAGSASADGPASAAGFAAAGSAAPAGPATAAGFAAAAGSATAVGSTSVDDGADVADTGCSAARPAGAVAADVAAFAAQTTSTDGADLEAADLDAGRFRSGSSGAEAGVGWLDTGVPISAAEARRMACDARIIPAVLGSDSQVLDLGRSRRLFSGAVRRALVLRDRGCSFPMCDRPARWSEGHHVRAWPNGGLTEPDNGCLVCRFHHRLLHDGSGWQVRIAADGLPEYLPPSTIDPARRPRRNTYHPRL